MTFECEPAALSVIVPGVVEQRAPRRASASSFSPDAHVLPTKSARAAPAGTSRVCSGNNHCGVTFGVPQRASCGPPVPRRGGSPLRVGHRMPQHPARRRKRQHTSATRSPIPQIEGEIAGAAHRLADLHIGAAPRMRVAEREASPPHPTRPTRYALQIRPSRPPPAESFGLSLSQAGERTTGR